MQADQTHVHKSPKLAHTDSNPMQVEKFYYDNRIVKNFAFATMLWGAVGMLAGLGCGATIGFSFT